MNKAGAIVALIAGIFGILAAGVTLLFGGIGGALKADGASTVVGLGWGGVFFSFAVIVLSAMAFSAKTKIIGGLMIGSSLLGIVLGGTLVAIFMALSLIGGILVTVGTKSAKNVEPSGTAAA